MAYYVCFISGVYCCTSRAVEDILRVHPQLVHMRGPSDGHTALHIASAKSRVAIVNHLANIVRLLYTALCVIGLLCFYFIQLEHMQCILS